VGSTECPKHHVKAMLGELGEQVGLFPHRRWRRVSVSQAQCHNDAKAARLPGLYVAGPFAGQVLSFDQTMASEAPEPRSTGRSDNIHRRLETIRLETRGQLLCSRLELLAPDGAQHRCRSTS
jgi:hypothetical protein